MKFFFRFSGRSLYKKSLLLIVAIVFINIRIAFAQINIFTPVVENTTLLASLAETLEKNYQQEINALPAQNKKDLLEIYKTRWENIKEKFDSEEIYTSPAAQQYLDALVAEIVKVNPLLQGKNFHCYFSRSGIPNASYIGEGVILFNMGLFSKLDNESQVVFVLCHELSHFYFNHSENSIAKYVATLNSDEVQAELRKIKKNQYGRHQDVEKLLKGLTFNTRRHGRDHESQADSMAIEFMQNSRFDIRESITTLALLDSIDIDSLNIAFTLQKIFNSSEYPFQKKWIAKEEGLLGGHAALDEDISLVDSLKTHPDCKLRIKILEPLLNKYTSTTFLKNVVDKIKFYDLKNLFPYEVVEYAFTSNNYARSFYYTIGLLQLHPSDPFLITQTGKTLNGFYDAQKNHKLGKVVDLPSPYYAANYNLLLQFIQNLYLENFALISYHFLKPYNPQLGYYLPFRNTYNKSLQLTQ